MMFPHTVKLSWERNLKWNKICAWGVEHFGLAGDLYTTNLEEEHMCWNFASAQDKLLFVTAWGDDQ